MSHCINTKQHDERVSQVQTLPSNPPQLSVSTALWSSCFYQEISIGVWSYWPLRATAALKHPSWSGAGSVNATLVQLILVFLFPSPISGLHGSPQLPPFSTPAV